MPVHLRKILDELSISSVRQLMKLTGSPETSVYRQGQIASIELLYRRNGGIRGRLGVPLNEVSFDGTTASRHFAGGAINFLDGPQGPSETWVVDIKFLGFECIKESDWDQASGADEPYFLIGALATNGTKVVKFGPYKDINSGTARFELGYVTSGKNDGLAPPIFLGVTVMEADLGSTEEAEAKVREVLEEAEKKIDQAAGAFMGASIDNHVMPEWLRDIYIGWIPEGIAELGDLADDEVGKMSIVLFDYKPEGGSWVQPPEIGTHGLNKYTHKIPIDGGSEGSYNAFFHVRIWRNPAPELVPF